MISALHDMIARFAQPGRVRWIGVRPERRAAMVSVDSAWMESGGLDGDHGGAGKRAVTLVQYEHLAAIGSFLGRDPVPPEVLRRNIVVSGINLAGLKGRQVWIGDALIEVTGICAPCSRMEEALGPGGYAAVRGHGGWCARVLGGGRVGTGDAVVPVDPE